jgi:hypothetical protein
MMFLDYPWADLGKATVVDVGGGVGKSPHYSSTYQHFNRSTD